MLYSMQEVLTEQLPPKQAERLGAEQKTRKNSAGLAWEFPECALRELEKRSNTETTVMRRILHFSLRP